MAKIRDRLSHHYYRIDLAQLWVVAQTDIPALANPVPVDRTLTFSAVIRRRRLDLDRLASLGGTSVSRPGIG